MIDDCTAIILAGGESRRMGSDKAGLVLNGQTLLQKVGATMQSIFPKTIVSVRQRRNDIALPQVCDDAADSGPLAGVAAGLRQVDTPWTFVVACDMPFIAPKVIELLAQLRGNHQAVVPQWQGQAQPLAAFYARDCSEIAQQVLSGKGRHSMLALLERLDVRYVDEAQLSVADPLLRSFFDLDTPQDVAATHGMK